jgi:hypothetical protein
VKLNYDTKVKVKGVLMRILEYTNKVELAATEHSVEEYINMVQGRQGLFDELEALRAQETGTASGRPGDHTKIDAEIKELTRRISEREKHHNSRVAGMMEDLKKGMRDLSAEKAINAIYSNDSYESGTMFNSKN